MMYALTVKDFPTMFIGCASMANDLLDKLDRADVPYMVVPVTRAAAMAAQNARTEADKEKLVDLNNELMVLA